MECHFLLEKNMGGSSFTFNEVTLKEEVKRYMTLKGQQACQYARDILKAKAASYMELFYNHYIPDPNNPKSYKRTYGVRDHSIQPFYRQYGNLIIGGVFLNGYELSKGQIYHGMNTTERIASMNSVWNFGEHGSRFINSGIRMIPTPHDLMKTFWTRQKMSECISHGDSIAKMANYRLLYFK